MGLFTGGQLPSYPCTLPSERILAVNISLQVLAPNFSLLGVDSLLIAGSLTTIALIFGVGGILLSGYLVDRKRPEILAVLIALVCIPLLLLMGTSEGLMLIIFTAAFAFVYFMGQPVYNSLVADYSPNKWRGRMFGISFFCAFGFGSFSASLLGYVAEKLSTNWIFWVILSRTWPGGATVRVWSPRS